METAPVNRNVSRREDKSKRPRSGTPFPAYGLLDSIAVAKAIYEKGGGHVTKEHLAVFLEYKSIKNGAFLSRLGAAKMFSLVSGDKDDLRISPLGQKILMPESDEELRAALVEAFFSVPLFKGVYEEYRGKDLPEGLGLKNALRLRFEVVSRRVELAYRTLFESAEAANFFEIRGGSKTQLIVPMISRQSTKPTRDQYEGDKDKDGSGGSRGGGPIDPPISRSRDDLQNEYVATLIGVLREKSKQGEMDNELMERIERLLEIKSIA